MPEPLDAALARLRALILDPDVLVRALASGRRRGASPAWRRVELRYVSLKAGVRLQVVRYDETQAHTSNHASPDEVLDELFAEPFGNWHVETVAETHQLRVTKSGEAVVSVQQASRTPSRDHDRTKDRVLPEDHPVLLALGISGPDGRVKPTRRAKYRQVEEFVRLLAQSLEGAPLPTDRPLRVVDLGCGNAYLTFAAHAYLSGRGFDVRMTGVDVKEQSARHNASVAATLGISGDFSFVVGGIGDVQLPEEPDVVLALHACDTATDDALARAVTWEAPLVLAAPCCHHDVAAQLRRSPTPAPYSLLTRHGILRERFADTLTDAVRAGVLRLVGYRVDVIEFVESKHTPRNTLLRAVRTGAEPSPKVRAEYDDLVRTWNVHPALAERLHDRLG